MRINIFYRNSLACVASIAFVVAMFFGCPDCIVAADGPPSNAKNASSGPAEKSAGLDKPTGLTVAVLDFTASYPSNPKLGAEIAAALTAVLAGEPGLTLVDRQTLSQSLKEHELNLTGAAASDPAAKSEQNLKIGKLVGAKILVSGRAFRLGKDLFITAKMVGTETSLLEGVMVRDGASADMGNLVMQLAEKVVGKIHTSGAKITAAPLELDPVPELMKNLAARRKPVVAVLIAERHQPLSPGKPPAASATIDAAAETEVKRLLIECGFEVIDVPHDDRAAFGNTWTAADTAHWPAKLEKVEYLVTGQAFSELAARIGNIVSCSARVDVSVVHRADGKLFLAESANARAADLSEAIAAKKALQSGGRIEGIRILQKFEATLAK